MGLGRVSISPQVPRRRQRHIAIMCGRVIQSSRPIRYGVVEGMDMRDSHTHNYLPKWNAASSQDLLVIRRKPPRTPPLHPFSRLKLSNCYS